MVGRLDPRTRPVRCRLRFWACIRCCRGESPSRAAALPWIQVNARDLVAGVPVPEQPAWRLSGDGWSVGPRWFTSNGRPSRIAALARRRSGPRGDDSAGCSVPLASAALLEVEQRHASGLPEAVLVERDGRLPAIRHHEPRVGQVEAEVSDRDRRLRRADVLNGLAAAHAVGASDCGNADGHRRHGTRAAGAKWCRRTARTREGEWRRRRRHDEREVDGRSQASAHASRDCACALLPHAAETPGRENAG